MRTKYSIIIATKNEEEGIAKVICSIPKKIKNNSEVIVADSSDDMTPIIAERLGAKVINIKGGKGKAIRVAAARSKGEILIFLDGDGTDPPEYIPKLLRKLENFDLVLGCRSGRPMKGDDPQMRKIFKIYCAVMRTLSSRYGFYVNDPLAGFRAIRKKDWQRLDLKTNSLNIETEMDINAIRNELKVGEVLIPHLKRAGGLRNSKLVFYPKIWFNLLNTLIRNTSDMDTKMKILKLKKKRRLNPSG